MHLSQGVFNSNWWRADVQMKKEILLLAGKLSPSFILHAGPFSTFSMSKYIESMHLSQGVFNSNWWRADVQMKKEILLLAGKLSPSFILHAGPFSTFSMSKYIESMHLSQGVFNSNWWRADVQMKKEILLLAGKLSPSFILHAGPFSTFSMSKYIEIMKGSYSFYTLFTQIQEPS